MQPSTSPFHGIEENLLRQREKEKHKRIKKGREDTEEPGSILISLVTDQAGEDWRVGTQRSARLLDGRDAGGSQPEVSFPMPVAPL